MIELQDKDIAYILTEIVLLFFVGGLVWCTTPFRRRKTIESRLFFIMEVCCFTGLLSDIIFFYFESHYHYGDPRTLAITICSILGLIMDLGNEYFEAFLVLYTFYLATGRQDLLRKLKIPVLLVPTLQLISMHSFPFLPESAQIFQLEVFSFGMAFDVLYHVMVLVLIFFVDRKLLVYVFLTIGMVELLEYILPEAETQTLFYVLVLVFSHIIVMNRTLETEVA